MFRTVFFIRVNVSVHNMPSEKPQKIYEREINGFKAKTLFREGLARYPEWAYNLKSIQGIMVYVPPHFFESAYRRVQSLDTSKKLFSRFFSDEEISKLVGFIEHMEKNNGGKNYGKATIQLILNVADSAIKQRRGIVSILNKMSPNERRKIQEEALKIRLKNHNVYSPFEDYANLITSQKIKFSSRSKRYPFVFSLLNRNPDKILLNTVYLKGDNYPKNTIIVYSI